MPKDIAYKHGSWSMDFDSTSFDKDKLMLTLIEKLKSDLENNDPSDKKAKTMINELLYHYCWKVSNADGN